MAKIIDEIYAGIVNAETGGLEGTNAFIRTKAKKTKGGSTAYGPAQITGTLAKDMLDRGFIPKELKDYVSRFIKQSEQFNKYGNEAKKFGKNHKPQYDYGGSGDLTSPQDQKDYERLAKLLLSQQYNQAIENNAPNPVEAVTNGWRFGVNSDKTIKENDPDYGKRFAEVFTGEEVKVADTSNNFAEQYMRGAENEIESLYGKRPEEVIKETETVIKETPSFYANQNITDIPQDGTYTLPPDQIITPFIRETIKEDVTVQPQPIIQAGDVDVSGQRSDQRSENDRMQEAARRSMMQGNYQDRMDDYEYARYDAQENPGSYPARIVEPTPPPMQAAQRMMGGYAQGGTVNQAQGLASLGRGGDSTLVHMQPQEVAGLQQLAQSNGTSLTRNPMTGYPEAFSLKGVLKAAAPIAAGYFLGPAAGGLMTGTTSAGYAASGAIGGSIAAGAATGAAVAAATGDDPITGAVSGGFGGMSGGNLNTAFGGAGVPEALGGASSSTIPSVAGNSVPYAGGELFSAAPSSIAPSFSTTTADAGSVIGSGSSGLDANVGGPSGGYNSATNSFSEVKPGNLFTKQSNVPMGEKLSVNLRSKVPFGNDPVTGDPKFKYENAGPMKIASTLGAPVASMGLGGLEASDFISDPDFDDPRDKYNPYSKLNLSNDTGISESLAADTGLRLFAEGGNVAGDQKQALNLNSGSNVAGNNAGLRGLNLDTGMMGVSAADLAAAAMARRMTSTPGQNVGGSTNQPFTVSTRKEYGTGGPNEVPEDYRGGLDSNYDIDIAGNFRRKAQGGMIRGYAEGGYLQGPGDGMSDDIPATINGDEPAALADGEFVVPADVVSHIGNGSSEAGSKQLYAMMDRIRKARTGRESQGKEIKPGKYMPR